VIEVWRELPTEFRLPDPEAMVTLWRGDKLGKLVTGMSCRLTQADPVKTVLEAARVGYDALIDLVDEHTSAHPRSPLVSVAADIRLAQFFADSSDENETIYEINILAHRILRDPENIGTPLWPKDSELFVIGTIDPSDIARIKSNNSEQRASELLFWENGRSYIADYSTNISAIPTPQLPNPLGEWVDSAVAVNLFEL
jgi:hypothetical protein